MRTLDAVRNDPPVANELPGLITEMEAEVAISDRLPALLAGEEQPVDDAETLVLAKLCNTRSQFALAAQFWESAWESDPSLFDDPETQLRFNAACAAVLASRGAGKDSPVQDANEQSRLRNQALQWLKSELDVAKSLIETGSPEERALTVQMLESWRLKRALAEVRDPIANLPESSNLDGKPSGQKLIV